MTYNDIAVGHHASFRVVVTAEFVANFAALSGDQNPLHMDEAYAAGTQFGGRVAHGMIVGALFSRLVGMHLPGASALYLSQTLRFHQPIYIGTELLISGTVTHMTDAHQTITIHTTASDAAAETIAAAEKKSAVAAEKIFVSGDAMVQVLP